MKIVTILGTRPEIIRLSRTIARLDQACTHVVVHTEQNFDDKLNDVFFRELGIRAPDYSLGVRGETPGRQIARIIEASEEVLHKEEPDRLLLLGDTNSALSAIPAKRLGIPVYHMEAGNRCYDDRVPEEINRRIVDHCSDVLMPYTHNSRLNLLREGIPSERIFVTGNPINEVIWHYDSEIKQSNVLSRLGLEARKFFLVTMHREENVDVPKRLAQLTAALEQVQREYGLPVIVSTHPRTRTRLREAAASNGDLNGNPQVRYLDPFGFFDFITLEREEICVLSDSGTVQEECCIFHTANVTLRDVTERPETLECGSNILSGAEPDSVMRCLRTVLERDRRWTPPLEYLADGVSSTVAKIVLDRP